MTEHDKYLRYLSFFGADERLDPDERETWEERLNHELDIISQAGFASYFLIVWDLIKYCRKQKIPVGPGRGSVCGSLVTYCLFITDVDPVRWDIPFARFLHLDRISMPDIDLDLCKNRRDEVVQYIKDKYGEASVAQIVTYGTIQARGAVRRAFKDLEVEKTITGYFSMKMADELASLVPEGSGADQTILSDWITEDDPAAQRFLELIRRRGLQYADAIQKKEIDETFLLDTVLYLEGRRAHGSVHSAGLVIGSKDLVELAIPIGKRNQKADPHSDYDMNDAETVGLLKLDILGLRTVTLIDEINRAIPDFEIKDVPLDDPDTFTLFNSGQLKGVFQVSKDSIANALKGIRPSEFEDIIALLALYRPGPMEQLRSYAKRKLGNERVTVPHEDLAEVLSKTYGLIVYQEQVMGIAQIMADYTPGEGDIFRKAIGKKIPKLIREEIGKFTKRAIDKGYDKDVIKAIGTQIADFGRYGFNRGHATGYAYLTYWTAYLKCHYPVEFYAAVFNSYVGDADQISLFGADARATNVQLLPPHINKSDAGFKAEGKAVRWGFNGIKGLGDAAVLDIVEYRDSKSRLIHTRRTETRTKPIEGSDKLRTYKASIKYSDRGPNEPRPYDGFGEFCWRLPHIPINVKLAMIAAGCFDNGDLSKRAMLYASAPDMNKQWKKKIPGLVKIPEEIPTEAEMLQLEKDTLGSFVSHHPLEQYKHILSMWDVDPGGLFSDLRSGRHIKLAGIVMNVRDHIDKKGNEMAWLTVESEWIGITEIMVFASIWKKTKVEEGDLVLIEGKKTDSVKFGTGFQAEHIQKLDPLRMRATSILLTIQDVDATDIVWIQDNLTGTGARISILTNIGDKRLALMRTKGFIKTTIHALEQFQSRGWEVRLNFDAVRRYNGEVIHRTDQTHQGRGTKRRATWELPTPKLITRCLGGKVIAEYTFE